MTATMSTAPDGSPQGHGPEDGPLLEVEDLHVVFDTDAGVVHAVNGISFTVSGGETVALVGESGSGKSVTGMSLLRLLPRPAATTTGVVRWKGQDLVGASESRIRKVRGGEISMIFQDAMTSLNPVMTVGRQITEMIELHLGLKGRAARERAVEMLASVGIPNAVKRFGSYPHEFSGGMRQRAMIAMAISCDPQLIIADEPTTALDVTVQAQVLEVLAEIQERTGAGMILITHDLGVVAGVADRVMVMYAGRQVETAETDDIFYDTRHPYTLGLMASLPRVDVDGVLADDDGGRRLKPIEGQPPSLLALPSGCSFHPRCELAELPGRCDTEVPELLQIGTAHRSACHFASDLAGRAVAAGSDYAELVDAAAEPPAGTPAAGSPAVVGEPPPSTPEEPS